MLLKWTDVHDIALDLIDTWPELDPRRINFVDLRDKITALPNFDDDSTRCGEKILEAVQAAWIEEL